MDLQMEAEMDLQMEVGTDSEMGVEKAAERDLERVVARDSAQDSSSHTFLLGTSKQRMAYSPRTSMRKSSKGTTRPYAEVAMDLQMVAVDLQMVAERVPERAADAGCVYADGDYGRPRCNRHMPIGIVRAQSSHPMREHVWRCEAATVAACEAVPAPASEAVPAPARKAVPAPARTEATVEATPESTCWSSCSSSRGPRSCNCHTHTHTHTHIVDQFTGAGTFGGCALRCSKEARVSCKGKISPSGGARRAILVSTIDAVRSIRALLLDASVALIATRADLTLLRMLAAVLLIGAVRALAARRFGAGFDRAAMGGP
jgi:hypothetical protein